MAIEDRYRQQVLLLVQLLPIVAKEREFALKGGTAINLFDSDMPRLSVDIDLTYLGLEPRKEALNHCQGLMERIAETIERQLPRCRVERRLDDPDEIRLIVRSNSVMVKIESSPVARGVVGPLEIRETQSKVQDEFGYAEIQCVSSPELYGGKICAALDRQHPRDLFDVRQLMARGGLTRAVIDGFLVAVMSSRRPMAEILDPNRKTLTKSFVEEFQGMTETPVSLESLDQAREDLLQTIGRLMTEDDWAFLVDFKRGEPDWNQFAYPNAQELPAVRWKQLNLDKMRSSKREAAVERLDEVLKRMI